MQPHAGALPTWRCHFRIHTHTAWQTLAYATQLDLFRNRAKLTFDLAFDLDFDQVVEALGNDMEEGIPLVMTFMTHDAVLDAGRSYFEQASAASIVLRAYCTGACRLLRITALCFDVLGHAVQTLWTVSCSAGWAHSTA